MKKSFVLLAWWFLLIGKGSSLAPDIFMVVGPFTTQEDCEARSSWAKKKGAKEVSDCWEGQRDL